MDIEILLALQNMREGLSPVVEDFFVNLSAVAAGVVWTVLALVVYWSVDKRVGSFVLGCFLVGNFVNQFIKDLVCCYRPWVRDTRIIPASGALPGATGYSFPSGHTAATTSALGAFAWEERKKHRWIVVVCVVTILLVAFSRTFLGVHTPQDVLAGLVEGVIVVAIAAKCAPWLHEHREKDLEILIASLAVCIAIIIIVTCKPYPLDYVDGVLLVDPVTMQGGAYSGAGLFSGAVFGWYLERRYVNFSTESIAVDVRVKRSLVGIVLSVAILFAAHFLFGLVFDENLTLLTSYFVLAWVSVHVVPWAFTKRERRA